MERDCALRVEASWAAYQTERCPIIMNSQGVWELAFPIAYYQGDLSVKDEEKMMQQCKSFHSLFLSPSPFECG